MQVAKKMRCAGVLSNNIRCFNRRYYHSLWVLSHVRHGVRCVYSLYCKKAALLVWRFCVFFNIDFTMKKNRLLGSSSDGFWIKRPKLYPEIWEDLYHSFLGLYLLAQMKQNMWKGERTNKQTKLKPAPSVHGWLWNESRPKCKLLTRFLIPH